MVKTRKQK